MTYSQIHKIIIHILEEEMKVFHSSACCTAGFSDDFYLSQWEVSLLLYKLEERFRIEIEQSIEENLCTMNQLVNIIYNKVKPVFVNDPCLALTNLIVKK